MHQIRGIIAAFCPDLAIDTVELLGEGDDCTAYAVNRVWVFRFAKHEEAARRLRAEASLLPKIAGHFELRIPVPQIDGTRATPAFLGHAMLPGRELTQARYLQLDDAARSRCAMQIARFLVELHATDATLARACGVPDVDHQLRARNALERAHEHLFPRIGEAERKFVDRTLAAHAAAERAAHVARVVLHGDLSPEHVLFDEERGSVTGIIDFGDLSVGDPAWDFVWIYEDYGLDLLARISRLYPTQAPRDFLARIHRFGAVAAIEWTTTQAAAAHPNLEQSIAQLRARVSNDDRSLAAMLLASEKAGEGQWEREFSRALSRGSA